MQRKLTKFLLLHCPEKKIWRFFFFSFSVLLFISILLIIRSCVAVFLFNCVVWDRSPFVVVGSFVVSVSPLREASLLGFVKFHTAPKQRPTASWKLLG